MKKYVLFFAAAAWLLVCGASPGWAAEELDPNILWVSDSTVGRLDNIIVQPNGNIIGNYGGTIKEIDATNGKLIRSFQNVTSQNIVNCIDLSADGRYLLCSWDEIVIVDLTNNEKKMIARGGGAKFYMGSNKIAYYTIDSKATGSDSSIVILDLESGKRNYIKTEELITNIVFSSDGRFMATGGKFYDGISPNYTKLKLWDAKTFKLVKLLDNIQGNYGTYKIEFSPDYKKVGFNFEVGNLFIFSTETYSKLNVYNENIFNSIINSFSFITNELIGIQYEKTSIISLTDNKITILKEFSTPGRVININKTRDKLYAGTGFKKYDGSLLAWDLNKVLSSITTVQPNLQINTEYKDGIISLSNLPELSIEPVIKILDLQGKIIKVINDLPFKITTKLDIKVNLTSGVYILQLTDDSKEYSSKFLVAE